MSKSPALSYLICATPRSGSTLPCEALGGTGLAGNPDEYFGLMQVTRWNEKWGTHTYEEFATSYEEAAVAILDYLEIERPAVYPARPP